jgi:hypothetical protein
MKNVKKLTENPEWEKEKGTIFKRQQKIRK